MLGTLAAGRGVGLLGVMTYWLLVVYLTRPLHTAYQHVVLATAEYVLSSVLAWPCCCNGWLQLAQLHGLILPGVMAYYLASVHVQLRLQQAVACILSSETCAS